jgi:hypothetical protein
LGAVSKPGLRHNFTYKPNSNFEAAAVDKKITNLEINEELPELDHFLQLKYKENYSRKPRNQHVKRQ